MIGFLGAYTPLIELVAFNALLAFSQYLVLRAGVFSLGTTAFAALGSYAAALVATDLQLPAWVGILVALVIGALAGTVVAIPLARLRGVFQALATLALVQVVLSITLNWVGMTGGAIGINGIPKSVGPAALIVAVVAVTYLMYSMSSSRIGRSFDIIREDETVAVSLGISVSWNHMLAFVLSGAIGGLAGGLHAFSSYSITPNEFGFHMVVMTLAMVVLGGRVSVIGPLVGALILTALPELLRGLQEYRTAMQGVVIILAIVFLPDGVADTIQKIRTRRTFSRGSETVEVSAR